MTEVETKDWPKNTVLYTLIALAPLHIVSYVLYVRNKRKADGDDEDKQQEEEEDDENPSCLSLRSFFFLVAPRQTLFELIYSLIIIGCYTYFSI